MYITTKLCQSICRSLTQSEQVYSLFRVTEMWISSLIFDILEEADYEGWVVVEAEQDPAKANPFEYAVKARKYIAENTGL